MEQRTERENGQRRSAIIIIAVLVLVLIAAFAAYSVLAPSAQRGESVKSEGYVLSSSNASTVKNGLTVLDIPVLDTHDANVPLAQVANGKPVLVNFWATWCPYCVAEMNDYQRLYEKYGDKISFVMLNVCDSSQEAQLGREYIAENGFTFPVYFDSKHEGVSGFGVRAYPTTVIISPDGELLMNRAGQINYESMDSALGELV